MALPRAVQKQADKARKLAQQAAQQPVAQPAEQAPVQLQPPLQPAPPPTAVESQPIVESVQPVIQEPVSALGEAPDPLNENWEVRFKNLRKARDGELNDSRDRVAQLERQLLDATQDQKSEGDTSSEYQLTEDERKEMTPDAVAAFEKMATKMERQNQTKQADNKAEEESLFFADVDSIIPNWKQINSDPRFVEWLKQADGFGGGTRHDTLAQARANLDSKTVASLFSAYAQGNADLDSNHGNEQPAPQAGTVEPGRSSFDPAATQAGATTGIQGS